MLPSQNRMRRSADFALVIKTGRRVRRGALVVHHAASTGARPDGAPQVGLVVARSVGGSVVRHAVSRKLRAQLSHRIDRLPAGSATVIRALPDAASSSSQMLGRDLDAAFGRLIPSATVTS